MGADRGITVSEAYPLANALQCYTEPYDIPRHPNPPCAIVNTMGAGAFRVPYVPC